MSEEFWERGQKKAVSEAMRIRQSHLSEILNGTRNVNKHTAMKFEKVTWEITGKQIPWPAWLFNEETAHPAFSNTNRG